MYNCTISCFFLSILAKASSGRLNTGKITPDPLGLFTDLEEVIMIRRLSYLHVFLMVLSCPASYGQAVKGAPAEGAPGPALTYHGLLPGVHTSGDVRAKLGEPAYAARWYSYKMYYLAKDRPGLFDVLHMHGNRPDAGLANIDAASVPEGYETEPAIRGKLGEPEYELRMATWKLLDYSEQGVRFALSPEGKTIGVAYFPHGHRRVPEGSRRLMDLSGLRQGPQPKPAKPAALNGLKVGVSETVLSPTGEDWLPHPYVVHDDLKARTAVFSDGELTVALMGVDLFGMGWDEINVIREEAKKLGIDHVVFGMSHNHAAGDTIGVYGHYPAQYIQHVQKQSIAGIEAALQAMQPVAELRVASRELPMDGIRVHGLIRNARNPGVLDPTISLIQALDASGKPIANIVHFACHVESLQAGAREISADFPGYMCEQMKEDLGGQPVFLNGALGGMVSGDNKARTHESSREMGLELAAIVKDLAKTALPPATFAFSAERRRLEIPMVNPNFKPLFESGLRKLNRGRVVTDMIYVKLGETQIITLPGELLPEVSFEILEQMDGFPRMLVGLGNDQLGYMIPPYDFRDDYYEETMSQGPSAGLQVRDTALMMLKGVR